MNSDTIAAPAATGRQAPAFTAGTLEAANATPLPESHNGVDVAQHLWTLTQTAIDLLPNNTDADASLAIMRSIQQFLRGLPLTAAIEGTPKAGADALVVPKERRLIGLEALYQAEGLGNVLADIASRMQQCNDESLSDDYVAVIKPLATRISRLTCVAMSVLDDDDTVEGLSARLEGVA